MSTVNLFFHRLPYVLYPHRLDAHPLLLFQRPTSKVHFVARPQTLFTFPVHIVEFFLMSYLLFLVVTRVYSLCSLSRQYACCQDDNMARLVVLSPPPLAVVEPSDLCHWANNGHNCPLHAEEHAVVTKHGILYCYSSSSNGTCYSLRGCPLNAAKSNRNEFFVLSDWV
jgi:hypothetical protein